MCFCYFLNFQALQSVIFLTHFLIPTVQAVCSNYNPCLCVFEECCSELKPFDDGCSVWISSEVLSHLLYLLETLSRYLFLSCTLGRYFASSYCFVHSVPLLSPVMAGRLTVNSTCVSTPPQSQENSLYQKKHVFCSQEESHSPVLCFPE